MFPLPGLPVPAAVLARMLNTLLQREDWARDRLARHSGKTVRFVVGTLKVDLAVQSTGLVQDSDSAVIPDVTLTIPTNRLGEIPQALRSRDPGLITALLHVQGDAALTQVVSELARDLRWDIEEDLSGLVGDMAARRLVGTASALSAGVRGAVDRLVGNTSEFLTEESGMMASRPAHQDMMVRLQGVRQHLDQLEARVSALASSGARPSLRRS